MSRRPFFFVNDRNPLSMWCWRLFRSAPETTRTAQVAWAKRALFACALLPTLNSPALSDQPVRGLDIEIVHTRNVTGLPDHVVAHRNGSPICGIDPEGSAIEALLLAGRWDDKYRWHNTGGTLACLPGAVGKCVLAGYDPSKGPTARERHQACIRMLRADYCGDGVSHTVQGYTIEIFTAEAGPPENVEAGWRADGATGIERTRLPDRMRYVLETCPDRLGDAVAPLLWNR